MARRMAATDTTVYRACVHVDHAPSRYHDYWWEETIVQGPYGSKGAARGQVAALVNKYQRGLNKVEGWVESAEFVWNPAGAWPDKDVHPDTQSDYEDLR